MKRETSGRRYLVSKAHTHHRSKSIKTGDKHRTNRMFRRRIYAQGFTILAMVAGSVYWESDRVKRQQYDKLTEEKKKKERHELWLKELDIREQEEQELRRLRDNFIRGQDAEQRKLSKADKETAETSAKESSEQPKGDLGKIKSALEEADMRRSRPIFTAVKRLWDGAR